MEMQSNREQLFQQYIMTLLRKIELKQEMYDELRIKFEFLDKEFADTILAMSVLKLQIDDLERQFVNLFTLQ